MSRLWAHACPSPGRPFPAPPPRLTGRPLTSRNSAEGSLSRPVPRGGLTARARRGRKWVGAAAAPLLLLLPGPRGPPPPGSAPSRRSGDQPPPAGPPQAQVQLTSPPAPGEGAPRSVPSVCPPKLCAADPCPRPPCGGTLLTFFPSPTPDLPGHSCRSWPDSRWAARTLDSAAATPCLLSQRTGSPSRDDSQLLTWSLTPSALPPPAGAAIGSGRPLPGHRPRASPGWSGSGTWSPAERRNSRASHRGHPRA